MANPITRDRLLWALTRHLGGEAGVHAGDLVREICGETSPALERKLRHAIEGLRREGCHICGRPEIGYYLARNADELTDTVKFLHDRALASLTQAAAMRRVSIPDLAGQLRIKT